MGQCNRESKTISISCCTLKAAEVHGHRRPQFRRRHSCNARLHSSGGRVSWTADRGEIILANSLAVFNTLSIQHLMGTQHHGTTIQSSKQVCDTCSGKEQAPEQPDVPRSTFQITQIYTILHNFKTFIQTCL